MSGVFLIIIIYLLQIQSQHYQTTLFFMGDDWSFHRRIYSTLVACYFTTAGEKKCPSKEILNNLFKLSVS